MPVGRKNLEPGERSSRLMDEENSSEETLVKTDERQEARALHLTQGGLRCLTVEPTDKCGPEETDSSGVVFKPTGLRDLTLARNDPRGERLVRGKCTLSLL